MSRIYTVFNHETGTESTMNQEQLESIYSELKSGTMEIVDETDTNCVES